MAQKGRNRAVDMVSLVKMVDRLPVDGEEDAQRRRRLVAELCKVVGAHVAGADSEAGEELGLSPRMRQTLRGLLRGDSEKQIAAALAVSPNTVHVYVKQLYRRFNVCSRGELLAKFVRGQ